MKIFFEILKKRHMIMPFILQSRRDMSSKRNRPFTVLVEGNIGCGKSTFMNHFEKYRDIALFSEPVDKWRDIEGHNLLEKMYNDPKKWAMTFQSYVQLTMVDLHKQPCEEPVKVMERSIFSARYCFVENLYQNGFLDGPEYAVLDEWFNWLCTSIDLEVNMIVYIRTHPEVALKRLKLRGREEEKSVSLDYLKQLHNLHENWLCPATSKISSVPVHVIDGNQGLIGMEEEAKRIAPVIFDRNSRKNSEIKIPYNLA